MDPNNISELGTGLAIVVGFLIAFLLPVIAAARAHDGFALIGTLILAAIAIAAVMLQPTAFGQLTAVLIWLGALMLGLAALYGRQRNDSPEPGTAQRAPKIPMRQ